MENLLAKTLAHRGMTGSQLAEKVKVNRNTIQSISTKEFIPSISLALRIAQELKTDVEEIFQLEEHEYPEP